MKPYWVTFVSPPFGFGLGVGVTAIDERDAHELALPATGEDVPVRDVKWVRAASELDQGHVIPNMGNMLKRGIWFPLGYEHLSE